MNLLLLPGNSPVNEEWTKEVESSIRPLFKSTEMLRYDHWQSGREILDVTSEQQHLKELYEKLSSDILLGKSAGAMLIIKSVHDGMIQPLKCVFIGIPILWAREHEFDLDGWIEGFSVPSLIVQKTNDPACPASELRELLVAKAVKNYQFVEVPGDDHNYENIEELKELIDHFVRES